MTNTSCMAEQLLISEKDVQAVFYTVYVIIGTAGIVGNIFMIIACTRYVLYVFVRKDMQSKDMFIYYISISEIVGVYRTCH